MATKQELEVQVVALEAEVKILKEAQPVDVQALKEENESLRASERKMALELITAAGESQSLLEKLQQADVKNAALAKELVQTGQLLDASVTNLAKSAKGGITPDKIEFDGSVKALVEHFRRQFCHENQRALILKD